MLQILFFKVGIILRQNRTETSVIIYYVIDIIFRDQSCSIKSSTTFSAQVHQPKLDGVQGVTYFNSYICRYDLDATVMSADPPMVYVFLVILPW